MLTAADENSVDEEELNDGSDGKIKMRKSGAGYCSLHLMGLSGGNVGADAGLFIFFS